MHAVHVCLCGMATHLASSRYSLHVHQRQSYYEYKYYGDAVVTSVINVTLPHILVGVQTAGCRGKYARGQTAGTRWKYAGRRYAVHTAGCRGKCTGGQAAGSKWKYAGRRYAVHTACIRRKYAGVQGAGYRR